jgi:hypothetical protein
MRIEDIKEDKRDKKEQKFIKRQGRNSNLSLKTKPIFYQTQGN